MTTITFPNDLDPSLSDFLNKLKKINDELVVEISYLRNLVNKKNDRIQLFYTNHTRIVDGLLMSGYNDVVELQKTLIDINEIFFCLRDENETLKQELSSLKSSSKSDYEQLNQKFMRLEIMFNDLKNDHNRLVNVDKSAQALRDDNAKLQSELSMMNNEYHHPLLIRSLSKDIENKIMNFVIPEYSEYGINYLKAMSNFIENPVIARKERMCNNSAITLWDLRTDKAKVIERWEKFLTWDDQHDVWKLIKDLKHLGNDSAHQIYSESMIDKCLEYYKMSNNPFYDKAVKLNQAKNAVIFKN
mmetsp:Transcript_20412/g.18549  ORF Transcript_20412/g.18549 Transcript_20412/m.18549 type:complete len:301 (-) Transcript_20412:101-1003(-)